MRILVAHVAYRVPGGEERVVEDEARMLRSGGHTVRTLLVPSATFDGLPVGERVAIASDAARHEYGRQAIAEAIAAFRPEVAHFHNLYPLLGVGAMEEAADRGVGVVRTLHNYRLSCLAGTHFYRGRACFACMPRRSARGVLRACYRGSRVQSWVMAKATRQEMDALTGGTVPHVALCLTPFMRDRLVGFGVPASRLAVHPTGMEASAGEPCEDRSGAVFAGRLSEEKGILGLVAAWPDDGPLLTVVGDGPQRAAAERAAGPRVQFTGRVSAQESVALIGSARCLVAPSLALEGLPVAVLEAFASGTPAIGYDVGAMAGMEAGAALTLVSVGDPEALAQAAGALCDADPASWRDASAAARAMHAERYSREASLAGLEAAYARAIGATRASDGKGALS
ncbi:MAG: glycosyltransferase family 4 protein [Actinobacteria bacterium]|nr:MAG: glycosyltransferase family 4 protein [Actinomycetota bacterium]